MSAGGFELSPLADAILSHECQAVELLLEHGARTSIVDRGQAKDLWIIACSMGNRCVIDTMWTSDPQHDLPGGFVAALRGFGDLEIAERLVELGADPLGRTTETTPLHAAATSSAAKTRWLLETAAVDVDARDASGQTALYGATDAGTARLLLEAGADPKAVDDTGRTPLHEAAMRRRGGEIVRTLILAGADPNAVSASGESPLQLAARRERYESIETLLRHGADPETQLDIRGLGAISLRQWARLHAERAPELLKTLQEMTESN